MKQKYFEYKAFIKKICALFHFKYHWNISFTFYLSTSISWNSIDAYEKNDVAYVGFSGAARISTHFQTMVASLIEQLNSRTG